MNYILVIVFLSMSAFSYFLIMDADNINKINITHQGINTTDKDIVLIPYPKKKAAPVAQDESEELKILKDQVKTAKKKANEAKRAMFKMQEDLAEIEQSRKTEPEPPKLKTHTLKYKAHAKVGENKYMVLGEYNGEKVYLTEGDVIGDSKVEKVTPKMIIIAGYFPVENNSFVPFSDGPVNTIEKDHSSNKDVVKPRIVVLPDIQINEDRKEEHEVVVIDRAYERESDVVEDSIVDDSEISRDDQDSYKEVPPARKKKMVLRSFVREAANNDININDYIYFNKTSEGYRVSPRAGFEKVFNNIGFSDNDEVIKINSNHVFSSSAMIDLLGVTTAKKTKLLIKNGNRYRVVMIDLLKVHEF